jgi:hypothetical protein
MRATTGRDPDGIGFAATPSMTGDHSMHQGILNRACAVLALAPFAGAVHAAPSCADMTRFLAGKATEVVCFHTDDLLTANKQTTNPITPTDNSILHFADGSALPGFGLPPSVPPGGFGFTPMTDRATISNGPVASDHAVPGIQVEGWYADDPTKQARFLLRFPDDWNGKLVVAGASGTRSEFNGDYAWSDYVLLKGYAYASQNKGVLNFYTPLAQAADPLACRLNPTSGFYVHFYDNDPAKPFTQWTQYMLQTAQLAQSALKATYNTYPSKTYAVGTSNGGYQVRRAIEEAPNLFDGGVDWEGTYINPTENILVDLPAAVKNFPAYVQSGYDGTSAAAKAIVDAGYPPDIVKRDAQGNFVDSLWKHYSDSYWELTACQWQKRFDPGYGTYSQGVANYNLGSRLDQPGVFDALSAVTTTGKIKKPLITVAGTMDALLPIKHQARAYEDAVNESRNGNNDHRNAQYRLYEVQNGNHIESYINVFSQLRVIQPYAQQAFDLLVEHVEHNVALPPSQCIPLDAPSISPSPAQPGNCADLFVKP